MKRIAKRILPKGFYRLAKRTYASLFVRPPQITLPEYQFRLPGVLKCVVSYNEYGGYCVPISSQHRAAARRILSGEVYEPETIDFIMSNCGEGDIVHAGTYFGDFLPALAAGCSSNSKIWAFEPNSESYRCANITIQINDIKNVLLTNAGLGSKRGTQLLRTVDEDGRPLGGHSKVVRGGTNDHSRTETITTVTIDDTIGTDRPVSIIHLDVEGYEREALTGALATIERTLPILVLEVQPDTTLTETEWFSKSIMSLGYRKIKTVHKNSIFACPR